jgi:hypothetical protein
MDAKEISPKIKSERQLRAITGLTIEQFFILLPIFELYLKEYIENKHKNKERKIGSGKKGDIPTSTEKLLFMLFYLKCYPTFDQLGFTFSLSGPSAYQYVLSLFEVLMKTLNHFGVLPHTEFKSPEEMQAAFKGYDTLLIDATERAVQRPCDDKEQNEAFSGKKKQHTDKATVIATLTTYILYVGVIFKGKHHDFGMFKKEFIPKLNWFNPFNVYVDLGYLGFANNYKTNQLHIPHKTPKKSKNNPNPQLTEEQKKHNKEVSSIRVRVEHAIRGMKRYRCSSDRCRNRIDNTKCFFKVLSAALWNFNLSY